MAKPRIFVSSTYYDLKHIRTSLENFITEMGYEAILFEQGDIPFKHDLSLDESCYLEIENSHMQILIVGGSYGSAQTNSKSNIKISEDKMYQFYNSITKIEYKTAIDKDIPVYVFVEKQVLAEYETYKTNRENETIRYAHVDSVNIFRLLDEMFAQKTGNYIKGFEKFEDISSWLRDQWAGLFADYLKNNRKNIEIKTLSSRIGELGSITNALKEYTEAIMRKIQPEDYENLILIEDKRIEQQKINNFQKEDLINYIAKEGNLKSTPEEVYRAFKSSKTVQSFMNKLKFDKSLKQSILEISQDIAEKDFEKFKARY